MPSREDFSTPVHKALERLGPSLLGLCYRLSTGEDLEALLEACRLQRK